MASGAGWRIAESKKGCAVGRYRSKIASVLALFMPALAYAGEAAAPQIDPLILFKEDRLERCGIQASFTADGKPLVAAVTLHRIGDKAQWVVEVSGAALTATPSDIALKTSSIDTRQAFSKPSATATGGYEIRADQSAFDSAVFMQEIMIGGASVSVTQQGGADQTFQIPGPIAMPVRQGYLMCSGDLFR